MARKIDPIFDDDSNYGFDNASDKILENVMDNDSDNGIETIETIGSDNNGDNCADNHADNGSDNGFDSFFRDGFDNGHVANVSDNRVDNVSSNGLGSGLGNGSAFKFDRFNNDYGKDIGELPDNIFDTDSENGFDNANDSGNGSSGNGSIDNGSEGTGQVLATQPVHEKDVEKMAEKTSDTPSTAPKPSGPESSVGHPEKSVASSSETRKLMSTTAQLPITANVTIDWERYKSWVKELIEAKDKGLKSPEIPQLVIQKDKERKIVSNTCDPEFLKSKTPEKTRFHWPSCSDQMSPKPRDSSEGFFEQDRSKSCIKEFPSVRNDCLTPRKRNLLRDDSNSDASVDDSEERRYSTPKKSSTARDLRMSSTKSENYGSKTPVGGSEESAVNPIATEKPMSASATEANETAETSVEAPVEAPKKYKCVPDKWERKRMLRKLEMNGLLESYYDHSFKAPEGYYDDIMDSIYDDPNAESSNGSIVYKYNARLVHKYNYIALDDDASDASDSDGSDGSDGSDSSDGEESTPSNHDEDVLKDTRSRKRSPKKATTEKASKKPSTSSKPSGSKTIADRPKKCVANKNERKVRFSSVVETNEDRKPRKRNHSPKTSVKEKKKEKEQEKPKKREERPSTSTKKDEPPQKKLRSSASKPKEEKAKEEKTKEEKAKDEKKESSTRSRPRCTSVKTPSKPESSSRTSSKQEEPKEESKSVKDSSNKNNDMSEKRSTSDRSKSRDKVAPSEAPPKPVIESPVTPQSDDSSDDDDQLATMPRENPETEVIETVVAQQTPPKLPPPQLEDVQEETTGIVATPQGETPPSEPHNEKPQEVITDMAVIPYGNPQLPEPQHEKSQEKITDMAVIPHGQLQSSPQHQLDSILEQDLPAFGSLLDSLDGFFESERAQTTAVDKIYENIIQQNNNLAISEVEREMLGPYQMHCAHLENPNDEQKEAIGSFRSKLAELTRHYMTTRRWEEHNPLMVAFKENKAALQALLANPAQLAIGDKSTSLGEAPPLTSLCEPTEDPERRQEEQKLLSELRCKAETEFHKKIVAELEVVMAPNSQQFDRASSYAFLGPSLLSALYGPNPTQSTSGFGTSHFQPSSSYTGPSTSYGQWHGF